MHIHIAGAYENEESAAHAYDLAALKYWGLATQLNFPVLNFFSISLIFKTNISEIRYFNSIHKIILMYIIYDKITGGII